MTQIDQNLVRWKPIKWWLLAAIALIWALWARQDASLIHPVYLL